MQYRSLRDLDWPLVLITLAISALGILQIFSAAHDTIWQNAWWKQIIFLVVGLVLFTVVSSIDYHTLLAQAYPLYGLTVVSLIAIFFVGSTVFGSTRWIPLPGGFMLQVSEFAKVVLILATTRFILEVKREPLELKDLLKLAALVGVPWVLVAKQPDLGTSLTYVPILGMAAFLGGVKWKYAVAIGLVVVLALPLTWFLLHDYQKDRLRTFLDAEYDPQGKGYQIIQSKIAVGHGGMWGRGVTQGTQTQLRFLPVTHTDFIFSSFAEEHGFVGVTVALLLFFLLLMQVVQNAQTAPDQAGMMLCMGVASLILFHVLVNVGMVVGLMPVTGIPLPLMSSGGSSLLSMFMMLGLVNNVRLRRFVN